MSEGETATVSTYAEALVGRRALVTGGSGYFGRRLIEALLRVGVARIHNFDLVPIGMRAPCVYVHLSCCVSTLLIEERRREAQG
jgi:NAD(P)-dependent dehydrogenase (short-subunit alcohol dehydrogenase family)